MDGTPSRKPTNLYHASIERMQECHRAFDAHEYVLSAYLAGVAVECVLQALAMAGGQPHDARHDLPKWLAKCPAQLQGQIKTGAAEEWSLIVALWDNAFRYLSTAGFLGYVRDKQANRGIAGGPDAVVREVSRRIRDAADTIHKRGTAQWLNSTRKS
ncbi:MAG TPA: hypothetical protein VK324_14120 [Tepidisphaeraceae bacterium]|nr:hypothetical protein [Tepidisphaeraceae bacterium]